MAVWLTHLQAAQGATTFLGVSFPTCYGPEYVSSTLMSPAGKQGIALPYIQPAKPQQKRLCRALQPEGPSQWLPEPCQVSAMV